MITAGCIGSPDTIGPDGARYRGGQGGGVSGWSYGRRSLVKGGGATVYVLGGFHHVFFYVWLLGM